MQAITSKDIVSSLDTMKMGHAVNSSLMDKCAGVCNQYGMNGTDFACQVEAFLMNVNTTSLTLDLFGKFEQEMHKTKHQVRKRIF